MDYFRKLMMVSITLAAFAALGNSEETQCRDTSEEATSEFSRDVRDAVCSLNRTAVDTVHKEIRARHGDNGTRYSKLRG